jgi:hypothetical protein
MKHTLFILFSVLTLGSCKWEKVPLEKVISKVTVSRDTIDADGTSIVTVRAFINPDADADKRTVNFSTTGGEFVDGKDGKIAKVAVFEGEELVATVELRAPVNEMTIVVSAEMAHSEIRDDYIQRDTIEARNSLAENIVLSSEMFSVPSSYDGSVLIMGTLTNSSGGNVSAGTEVEFWDEDRPNHPVNGSFKPGRTVKSGGDSKVTIHYSPGFLTENTAIYVYARIKNKPTATGTLVFYVRNVK